MTNLRQPRQISRDNMSDLTILDAEETCSIYRYVPTMDRIDSL